MRLLIIRPQPGADASAARAKAAGFEPIIMPFFEIRPRNWIAPDTINYNALLLTSSNAVRHAGSRLAQFRHLPVHSVGQRTTDAAAVAGLTVTSTGTIDVHEAVEAAKRAGCKHLLWLAGEDHRSLSLPAGMTIDPVIVYASEQLPLPDGAKAQIMAADAVALHSPRAATLFAQTVADLGLDPKAISIAAFSPAIAESAGSGWRAVVVAQMANDGALLSALKSLGTLPRSKA
jgi:uroporphyrinogen-III synthase